MSIPVVTGKWKSALFGFLTVVCFFACFIFAPLGSFIVWIFSGATAYFLFLSIWNLIPPPRQQYTRKRYDEKEAEMKAYIKFHSRILLSVFLGAILLVMIFLMMVL